jgi:hypothetical protein
MKKCVVRVWNKAMRGALAELKNDWCACGMKKCVVRV